jgi:hypothetical protein
MSTQRLVVPPQVIAETQLHLRAHGTRGEEGVVLWRGLVSPPRVSGAVVPLQDCSVGRFRVPLEERQRITRELAGTAEVIVAQVHSHPGHAFHSSIDDAEAIPRRPGALSLVVPDFAACPELLDAAALFELRRDGSWISVPLGRIEVESAETESARGIGRWTAWVTGRMSRRARSLI